MQVMREVDALDLMAAYRSARCPLLVISGTDHEWARSMLPEHLVPAWDAYRAWVAAQLAAIVRDRPQVAVAALPAGHDAHRDDPEGLLRIILAHLGTGRQAGTSKQA
jgi:pimeloyl-ACP methyl ester carboxylesterase